MTQTVSILGDGSKSDPYRADYNGDWAAVEWDHDNGEVTIQTLD